VAGFLDIPCNRTGSAGSLLHLLLLVVFSLAKPNEEDPKPASLHYHLGSDDTEPFLACAISR